MKNIILLTLIIVIAFGCKKKWVDPNEPAVETVFPNLVNGIPDKNKVLLLTEDFNNNNNLWTIYDDPHKINYRKIDTGY